MTFTQIVAEVMDRLNLTATTAQDRVENFVNARYRKVATSIGLDTSVVVEDDYPLDSDVDTDLPDYTVEDLEKVLRVKIESGSGGVTVLEELTHDDLTSFPTKDGLPRRWATKEMHAGECIITLDGFPSDGTPFVLTIKGYPQTPTLSGSSEPAFSSSFHDILVEGAMSDELRKMEKPDLAQIAEQNYVNRLSDLRMYIAKSAYLDIAQAYDRHNRRTWPYYWYNS